MNTAGRKGPALALALLLSLVGCSAGAPGWIEMKAAEASRAAYDDGFAGGAGVEGSVLEDFGIAGSSGAALALTPVPPTRAPEATATERKLIHRGTLRLAVGDQEATARRAGEIAQGLGGYVQSLRDDALSLRIPADRWEEGLEAFSSLGRVVGRDLEVQDVTEEFVDVELRLKNLRQLSDRLSELLARAETVEAALKVETELARVRGEIERLEGRLKLLRDRVAFATLNLELIRGADSGNARRLPFAWLQELGVERLLELSGGSR